MPKFVFAALCMALMTGTGLAITVETVPIGNAGNTNDPATGKIWGGVAYDYRIGKYDVTVGQYTAFLNAVAATDTYGLYDPSMATDLNIAGISQSCVAESCSYSVIGSPNHPVTYVSWGDAARFSNWLNNGQPTGAEGPMTTETGAYTLDGAITDVVLSSVKQNAGAKWFIPSESEWYKAAYYDSQAGHYWNYATRTNTTPTSAPPGNTPNTANFRGFFGYAVTGSTSYSPNQNYLTDVGAYTASASAYGTFDQNGDVFQWSDSHFFASSPTFWGGSWGTNSQTIIAGYWGSDRPTIEDPGLGFRVATVPEPSTIALAVIAGGPMWWWRKRVYSQAAKA